MDDSTCNDGTTDTVYVKLDTPIPLTWARLVFSGEAYKDRIQFYFTPGYTTQPIECSVLRTANVDATTVDFSCPTPDTAKKVVLVGQGVRKLCSLYISGGRNVALKQRAEQSPKFESWSEDWGASNAVDGRTDDPNKAGHTCTHTDHKGSHGWWELEFSRPVDISSFLIYNRFDCCQERLEKFKLTVKPGSSTDTPYIYTEPGDRKLTYEVVPYPPIRFPVRELRFDVDNQGTNVILTLCEVFVFGESHCQPGRFGLQCERTCNCADKTEACFVHSGGCPSGCAANYTGQDCYELDCPDGTYGDRCKERCSDTCAGTSNPCRQSDGACTQGCDPGYTGTQCQT
ncbi:hypothetical protein EGW08_018942, partial [Elysia chlorotica]